jgi:hypothetical protein
MPIVVCCYFIFVCLLTYYSLLKEREAMGCKQAMQVGQHCNDLDSDMVKPSVPSEGDSTEQTLNKLEESSKSFEKFAIWRRSLILANITTLLVFLFFHKLVVNPRDWDLFIPLHLTTFCLQYLHFNFQNYHVHRKVKDNVIELVKKLRKL